MSATLAGEGPPATAERAVAGPWFPWGGRGAAVLASGIGAFVIGGAFALVQQPAHAALAAVLGIVALGTAFVAPRVATLVAVFLLLTFLADRAPGVAGRQAAPAIVLVLLAAAGLRRAYDGRPLVVPRDVVWIAAYIVGLAITVVVAGDRATATESFIDALGFAAFVVVLLVRIDSEQWVRRFIWVVVAALGVLAALAVVQQVAHLYANDFGGLARVESDAGVMRSAGPLSANYFGQMLAVGAALAGYLALAARSRVERSVALGTLGVTVIALGYTYSRGAILGFLTAVVVAAFLRRARVSVVLALAVAMVLIAAFVLPPEVTRRVGSLRELGTPTSESDSSLRGRASENLAALEMWRVHPIVGVGPGNFEQHYLDYSSRIGIDPRAEERSAHSLYLESLAETGLVGSVPFFALIGVALLRPWRARRRALGDAAVVAEGVFVALIAFLVTALTLHVTFVRNMWIVLALGLVAGRLAPAASQSDPKPERA